MSKDPHLYARSADTALPSCNESCSALLAKTAPTSSRHPAHAQGWQPSRILSPATDSSNGSCNQTAAPHFSSDRLLAQIFCPSPPTARHRGRRCSQQANHPAPSASTLASCCPPRRRRLHPSFLHRSPTHPHPGKPCAKVCCHMLCLGVFVILDPVEDRMMCGIFLLSDCDAWPWPSNAAINLIGANCMQASPAAPCLSSTTAAAAPDASPAQASSPSRGPTPLIYVPIKFSRASIALTRPLFCAPACSPPQRRPPSPSPPRPKSPVPPRPRQVQA